MLNETETSFSAWLEQENSDLTEVEVDEVFGFMGDVGSEVSS